MALSDTTIQEKPIRWAKPAPSTREAIFQAYERQADHGFRAHLGASVIGKGCERALWYDFRWATRAKHPGRVLRLFETGMREEARLIQNLRATGATVLDVDPETGRQYRVSALGDHFGGSLDALGLGLIEDPEHWHVLEFKTHSASSFRELVAKGVRHSKPMHFAQMQTYMHLMTLGDALYLAVNKDTDDLYIERVRYDAAIAKGLLDKAKRIIFAARAPERLSNDPNWYECKWCDHREICHGDGRPERTCRSCEHVEPIEGGWHCQVHHETLSHATQQVGCGAYQSAQGFAPQAVLEH